jgi:dTDP-4-dehydrorhamnose reductase
MSAANTAKEANAARVPSSTDTVFDGDEVVVVDMRK